MRCLLFGGWFALGVCVQVWGVVHIGVDDIGSGSSGLAGSSGLHGSSGLAGFADLGRPMVPGAGLVDAGLDPRERCSCAPRQDGAVVRTGQSSGRGLRRGVEPFFATAGFVAFDFASSGAVCGNFRTGMAGVVASRLPSKRALASASRITADRAVALDAEVTAGKLRLSNDATEGWWTETAAGSDAVTALSGCGDAGRVPVAAITVEKSRSKRRQGCSGDGARRNGGALPALLEGSREQSNWH